MEITQELSIKKTIILHMRKMHIQVHMKNRSISRKLEQAQLVQIRTKLIINRQTNIKTKLQRMFSIIKICKELITKLQQIT